MNRRDFVKGAVGAYVAKEAVSNNLLEQPGTNKHLYVSPTISVQLTEVQPGFTSLYMIEHGDADYVVVEAFYWAQIEGKTLLLHKETTAPLVKGIAVAADLQMTLNSIVFLRVREMKLLKQTEFGKDITKWPTK